MQRNEKILAILMAFLGFFVLSKYTKGVDKRIYHMESLLSTIDKREEKLRNLSSVYLKYLSLKKNFSKGKRSLKELGYEYAKGCGMKVKAVMPKESSVYGNLKEETVYIDLEGTYSQLLCLVEKIEKAEGGFIYISTISVGRRVGVGGKDFVYSLGVKLHRLFLGE